jgi:hypothetical protein
MYRITTNRRTAIMYMAWEYGLPRAVAWAKDNPDFRFGVLKICKRKKDAEHFARLLDVVQAYQCGRIGKSLNDGSIFVEKGE